MKKTININLGGRIFYIEDDAFTLLESYLNEVKSQFGSYPDSAEIITDIEDRIAEHFEQNKKGKQENIISVVEIETLINVMGHASDFEADKDTIPLEAEAQTKRRPRLFRNPDDAILGGVAGGIAAYFDWDPLWVRLAFGLSILLGGYTIILYFILWLIVPIAETESDRLEMKGDPITLASLEKNIKDKTVSNPKTLSAAKKAGSAIGQMSSNLGRMIKQIMFALAKVAGIILMIGATLALFMVTFGLVAAIITGNNPNYIQFPLKDFLGHFQYYLALFTGYVIAFIPLLFAFLIGYRLFDKTKALFTKLTVALAIIWLVAIGTMGAIAVQNAPRLESYIESQPMFKKIDKEYTVGEFTSLEVNNNIELNIVEGPSNVVALATQIDLDRISIENKDGVLVINKGYGHNKTADGKWCLFCPSQRITVNISAENLQNIILSDSVRATIEKKNDSPLNIALHDASRLIGNLTVSQLQIELEDASNATLSGTAQSLFVVASDASRLYAENLNVEIADAKTTDASRLALFVTNTLKAEASDSSRIQYKGDATLTGYLRDPEIYRNDNIHKSQPSTDLEPTYN